MSSRLLKVLPVLLLAGCGPSSPRQVEVSGTVSYRGRPLPGGTITILSERGLQNSAVIDPTGHYQIKAAVGPAKVTVDNRMLRKDRGQAGPRLKPPPDNAGTPPTVNGTYVPLPPKYLSVDTSGLTCDVQEGKETCDFKLDSR